MLYHVRANFIENADQVAFNRFTLNFLTHSRLIELHAQGKNLGRQSVIIKNEIFGHFKEAFSGFE